MNSNYKTTLNKIQASDRFKEATLQKIMTVQKERRYTMNKKYKWAVSLGAVLLMVLGLMNITMFSGDDTIVTAEINLLDRIVIDENAISACAAVNIEGVITQVGEDGLSFKLDNGQWVKVTEATEIGITSPSAADVEEQHFEPTFRVGNMIAGFAENPDEESVDAFAIYTNWNWEDPIR